jgi:hypothetical protein
MQSSQALQQQQSLPPWQEAMASTAAAPGSHSAAANRPNTQSGGGMDELLPLVLQLTNAEQVSAHLK